MKNRFFDFISLSSSERKGVIVLVLIIFVLSCVQVFMVFHSRKPASFSDSLFFHEISSGGNKADSYYDSTVISGYDAVFALEDKYELFEFDPNTVSADELIRLGVSGRVARIWLNYRMHGGKFRTSSDIKKIYGMTPEAYERLAPYVNIKQETNEYSNSSISTFKATLATLKADINLVDSVELIKVRGIGPVLSGRIVRYRKLLGGFYTTEQLIEVYGFPDSLLTMVNKMYYADTAQVQTIHINEATEDMLGRHPYLGRYVARGIIKYRNSVVRINKLEELTDNGLLTREQFEKVKKYLDI